MNKTYECCDLCETPISEVRDLEPGAPTRNVAEHVEYIAGCGRFMGLCCVNCRDALATVDKQLDTVLAEQRSTRRVVCIEEMTPVVKSASVNMVRR